MNHDHFSMIQQILERGGVFAYPTETVYGLGTDPFQRLAVKKMMDLKGRSLHQTPLVLIPHGEWIYRLAKCISSVEIRWMNRFWPGPLTIVFKASGEVPPWLVRDDGTIAIRYSSHQWVQSFLDYYKRPILSTSANLSGQPVATSPQEIKNYFPSGIDTVVDGGALTMSKGSTVASFQNSVIQLFRKGDISFHELERCVYG